VRAREQCRASVSSASRGRDGATAVAHHHGVGHSAAFPERVQFPAEFGEFSRAASSSRARTRVRVRVRRRVVAEISVTEYHRCVARPGVASDSIPRDTRFRLAQLRLGSPEFDRLLLPYLAVHRRSCEKGNRERENSESSPDPSTVTARRDPRPWIAVAGAKSAPKQRDSIG